MRRKLDKTKFHNLQAGFEKDEKKEKKEKIGDSEIPLMSSKSFINKLNEYDNFAETNEEDNETNVNMNESDYYSVGSDKEKKRLEQLKSEEEEKLKEEEERKLKEEEERKLKEEEEEKLKEEEEEKKKRRRRKKRKRNG